MEVSESMVITDRIILYTSRQVSSTKMIPHTFFTFGTETKKKSRVSLSETLEFFLVSVREARRKYERHH